MLKEYICWRGKKMVLVHCKGNCKAVIALPANRGEPRTEHYSELVIEMREANGLLSKHETGMCKACKARILSGKLQPNELDNIYAQDVYQWIEAAIHTGTPRVQALVMADKFAGRTPIRALPEAGRGEL